MKVTRRQFLRVSLGAIGAAVVTEAVCFGADTSGVQKNAEKVPIRTGKLVPSLCPFCSVGCAQIIMTSDTGKRAGREKLDSDISGKAALN